LVGDLIFYSIEPGRIEEVKFSASVIIESHIVRQISDFSFYLYRMSGGVYSTNPHTTCSRFRQSEDHQNGGGFPRAIGTEQPKNFSGINRQIQTIDRRQVFVFFGQMGKLDDGWLVHNYLLPNFRNK